MSQIDRSLNSLGFQQITSLSSAAGLTIPDGTVRIVVHAETQNVRWRDDGTDPTASIGMILTTTGELSYNSASLPRLKFIETAASAKINVTYYGTKNA